MSTVRFRLVNGRFFQDWSDTNQITANDDWSGVPGIVGYLGDINAASPTGVDPRTLTAPALGAVDVVANQANPNTNTSGGVAEFAIPDPVVALQGSGTADAPSLVIYLDATGRENISFSVRVRDIDGSADNAAQQVAVQYRISPTGPWVNLTDGYISDATTGPSTTGEQVLTLSLPSDANNAAELEIRILTTNAIGNDEWVGLDDITVDSTAIATAGAGSFTIGDVSVAEGDAGTTPITFTVNRANGSAGAVTVDFAVGFGTATAADFAAGEAFAGTLTFADGETSRTITLQVAADAVTEPTERFTLTLSSPTGGALIGDASATGTIVNDDTAPVAISAIQGASHTSPFVGQAVTTSGVVTAVDTNGFYIQDPTGDGDARTSEGIFVFTGSTAPAVTAGQLAQVSGTVTEFSGGAGSLTVTQISAPIVTVTGTGTIAPTLIGQGGLTPPNAAYEDDGFTSFDPATDGLDFYESLEGMLVTIDTPLVVANTNDFGETFVVASGGAGATGVGERGGIAISAGDFNPERIQIDDDAGLFAGYDPAYTQGDRLDDVTGILNYAFRSYELLVTAPVTVTSDVTLLRETSLLTGDATALTIATYNVENLDPTDPQARFDLLANDIVYQLRAPDIVGLQEIQDADGAGGGSNLSGQATAQALIDAIVRAGGPQYLYVEVAPSTPGSTGGEPGGNIRNGFLYNPARVTYVEGSAVLVTGAAFNGSRNPLAADFAFNGEVVTVINVHLTARSGSDPLQGSTQPPGNAGDAARAAQGEAIRSFIDARTAADPEANIVTLGDFNSFTFEAPIVRLEAGGAQTDLNRLLPTEERYSYLFEGNLQALDHILVSANLLADAGFDAVHLNAEQPEAANRPTDHDPLLSRLVIRADDVIGGTAGNDVRRSGAGNDRFNLDAGGDDTASGGEGDDAFFFGAAFTAADRVDGGAGVNDQIGLRGDYSAGLTLGAGSIASVEVIAVLPGFDYRLTTVDANVAAGDLLQIYAGGLGAGDDLAFDGSAETNGAFRVFGGAGNDAVTTGAGDDGVYFGPGLFGAGDRVNGGVGANDQLGLDGNYTLTLGADVAGVEVIALFRGPDGDLNDYALTTTDALVAAGGQLTLFGVPVATAITFDGSAETDGVFRLLGGQAGDRLTGGAGADSLFGGLGADVLTGGAGADLFLYDDPLQSTATVTDTLVGFLSGEDRIDLSAIDADISTAGDDAFRFVGSAAFGNSAGELRLRDDGMGGRFLEGDVDGDGIADLVIAFDAGSTPPVGPGDFVL